MDEDLTQISPSDIEEDEDSEMESPELESQSDDEDQGSVKPGKKSAESRIQELIAHNKKLEEKLDLALSRTAPTPPPTREEPMTPDQEKAVEYLKSIGFVQRDDLANSERTINGKIELNMEHGRLENSFTGEDGRPKYDRQKVESYMTRNGIYNPEIAYKAMHEAELLDWAFKNAKRDSQRDTRPKIKGGSTGGSQGGETLTRETLAEWIKTPEGRIKYEKNRVKIMEMMKNGQL